MDISLSVEPTIDKDIILPFDKITDTSNIMINSIIYPTSSDSSTSYTPSIINASALSDDVLTNRGKILITGTGRAGTTFLMIIFSYLNLDTGYNRKSFTSHISTNCNSGLEVCVSQIFKRKQKIIKNPRIFTCVDDIISKGKVELVIIPIRNYDESATSRVKHGIDKGGYFGQGVKDKDTQLSFYYENMAKYIYNMVKYDIPTIFIDFTRMVSNPKYLFDSLMPLLKHISYEDFLEAYEFATKHQKKEKTA